MSPVTSGDVLTRKDMFSCSFLNRTLCLSCWCASEMLLVCELRIGERAVAIVHVHLCHTDHALLLYREMANSWGSKVD